MLLRKLLQRHAAASSSSTDGGSWRAIFFSSEINLASLFLWFT
jgi:hypothetical protein